MSDIDTKLKALEEGNFFTKEATALVDALAAALLRARKALKKTELITGEVAAELGAVHMPQSKRWRESNEQMEMHQRRLCMTARQDAKALDDTELEKAL